MGGVVVEILVDCILAQSLLAQIVLEVVCAFVVLESQSVLFPLKKLSFSVELVLFKLYFVELLQNHCLGLLRIGIESLDIE